VVLRARVQQGGATADAARAHAARQAEYRARRAKVTHQTDGEVAAPATVSTAPETAMPAASGAAKDTDAKNDRTYGCARCGRRSNYVRYQTLAKYRPRWRRPP
jgi:hypothetical protein